MSEGKSRKKNYWANEIADLVGESVMVFGICLTALFAAYGSGGSAIVTAAMIAAATAAFGFFGAKCHTLANPVAHLTTIAIRIYSTWGNVNGWYVGINIVRIVIQILVAMLAGACFRGLQMAALPAVLLPASLIPAGLGWAEVLFGIVLVFDLHLLVFPSLLVEDVFGTVFSNGFSQLMSNFLSLSVIRISTNYNVAFAFFVAGGWAENAAFGWSTLVYIGAAFVTFLLYALLFKGRFSPEAIKRAQANYVQSAPMQQEIAEEMAQSGHKMNTW